MHYSFKGMMVLEINGGGWVGGREGLGDGPIRPASAGACCASAIVVVLEIPLLEKKKGKKPRTYKPGERSVNCIYSSSISRSIYQFLCLPSYLLTNLFV